MKRLLLLLVSLSVGLPATVVAQTPSTDLSVRAAQDAARRAAQAEASSRPRQAGDPVVSDPRGAVALPKAGGPTVRLSQITFSPPSAFLSPADLEPLRVAYLNKRVDFRKIQQLVAQVNALYAERGIVTAAAVLPPQDLSSGKLEIRLIEGQLGAVKVVGEHQTKTEYLLDRVRMTRAGNTVDVPQIGKDLNYFNQTSRAKVRMLLEPGAGFGLTDLTFGISEPRETELRFFFDNTGVETTGKVKLGGLYRRYGWAGIDDTLLVFGEIAEGAKTLVLRYDFPITKRNARLDLGLTGSRIKVVDGPTEPLDVTGDSLSFSTGITQPLFADDKWLVEARGAFFWGKSASRAAGVTIVDTRTRKASLGVNFRYKHAGRRISGGLQLVRAKVADQLTNTDQTAAIGLVDLQGEFSFGQDLRLIAKASAQHTKEKLLPGNLLYQIGGPTTVRGYPAQGVAGDTGYLVSFELHKDMVVGQGALDLFGFVDAGRVNSTFAPETNMNSVGVGMSYQINDQLSLDLTLAVPRKNVIDGQSRATVYATLEIAAF